MQGWAGEAAGDPVGEGWDWDGSSWFGVVCDFTVVMKLEEGRSERWGKLRPVMMGLLVLLGGGSRSGEVVWGKNEDITRMFGRSRFSMVVLYKTYSK